MSRRARARKGHPRRRIAATNAVQMAINGARLLDEADVEGHVRHITRALTEFSCGVECQTHWLSLADTVNMTETFASMGIGSGPDAERVINEARKALGDVHQRHAERGTWTLWADEIDALGWLVQLMSTQMRSASFRDFETAFARTKERIAQAMAGNASPGARLVVGLMGRPQPGQ